MYDEDHSGLNGTGQVYDDIVSAVNHRGVTQIDIIGYSHGGGSTYTLARRLSRNQSGGLSDIFREFSIRLTAYVDAVRDSGILAETRRPPGSRYHMNFYQQRTLLHGAPSNANEEREVTNLDISHRTIDDLDWILARIRRRILARTKR